MKLSTCMSKYAPTFTYGQQLYVVAEKNATSSGNGLSPKGDWPLP